MQENLCPIFWECLKNTYRIFSSLRKPKKSIEVEKISPPLEKNIYNRTARYVVYACRPTWKIEWKILKLQTGLTGTFDFIWEKATIFIFSVAVVDSSEFIYQWEEQMKKRMMN